MCLCTSTSRRAEVAFVSSSLTGKERLPAGHPSPGGSALTLGHGLERSREERLVKRKGRDFPGGPMAKTSFSSPMQGA